MSEIDFARTVEQMIAEELQAQLAPYRHLLARLEKARTTLKLRRGPGRPARAELEHLQSFFAGEAPASRAPAPGDGRTPGSAPAPAPRRARRSKQAPRAEPEAKPTAEAKPKADGKAKAEAKPDGKAFERGDLVFYTRGSESFKAKVLRTKDNGDLVVMRLADGKRARRAPEELTHA